MQILDCTFRDGGYYNNWDFTDSLFEDYLSVLGNTKVDLLEIGFRFPLSKGFRGAHAYTTDDYVASFEIPDGKSLGVMINVADRARFESTQDFISHLFGPADRSPIEFVRIASHEAEIPVAKEIARILMDHGYVVAVNLMQISEVKSENLSKIATSVSSLPLMSLYVADSLGSMKPETIESTFKVLSESTSLPLGLHAHDNLGLAHQNSMVAIEKGARFVDGTLRGMGRGPGNTKTEELAVSLHSSDNDFEGALKLGHFSDTTWAKLQDDLGWGRNLAYFAAGLFRVHPTYVQELLADSRQDKISTLRAVRNLSQIGAQRFDKEKLAGAGKTASSTLSERSVLPKFEQWQPGYYDQAVILGPGASLQKYKRALAVFIAQNPDALVLSVNDADLGHSRFEGYRVISHRRQIDANLHFFSNPNCRIILPLNRLASLVPEQIAAKCSNVDFMESARLGVSDGVVESPVNNVFAYAFGLAHLAGAKRLFIAGFDGIGGGDSRDFEMVEILNEIRSGLGFEVWSLTPTKLPLETISPLSPHGPKNES